MFFAALLTEMCMSGISSLSSALDLNKKITDNAEEAKEEETDKAKDMAEKSEEKKDEGNDKSMTGDI